MTGRKCAECVNHDHWTVGMVLQSPPVGVGIVCLIVGVTSGHLSVLELVWVSYVLGYLTARLRSPRPPAVGE